MPLGLLIVKALADYGSLTRVLICGDLLISCLYCWIRATRYYKVGGASLLLSCLWAELERLWLR